MKFLFVHSSVDDAALDVESFRVLCHVARRAGDDGVAFMGVKSAAKICRLNKDTIAKRLRDLCELGWLERVKRPGMASGFRLSMPPEPIRQEGISDNEGYPLISPPPIRQEGLGVIRQEGIEGNPIKVIQEGNPKARAKRDRFDAGAVDLPFSSEAFSEAWKTWVQHRKEKRSPLTPTATKQQLANFKEWGEQRAIAAINHSAANGWTGLFEPNTATVKTSSTRTGDDMRPLIPMPAWEEWMKGSSHPEIRPEQASSTSIEKFLKVADPWGEGLTLKYGGAKDWEEKAIANIKAHREGIL